MTATALFEQGQHWVKITRRRLCPHDHARADDLESEGMIALWRAAESFDPARGTWMSYALTRIRGAMLHFIRSDRWEPRRVYEEQQRRKRDGLEVTTLRVVSLETAVTDRTRLEDLIADAAPGPEALALTDPEAPMLPRPRRVHSDARHWTPEQERILLHYHATLTYDEIAALVGKSRSAVQGKVRRMRSLFVPYTCVRIRHWTAREDAWLAANLGRGHGYRSAAKVLRRTFGAVKKRSYDLGIGVRRGRAASLSQRDVSRILSGGRSYEARVLEWLRSGVLRGEGGKQTCRWVVWPEALIEFLQAHPELYEAEMVRDPRFARYARPGGIPGGYVTVKEAARAFGITPQTVRHHIYHGNIPAVKFPGTAVHAGHWWIPRGAVRRKGT